MRILATMVAASILELVGNTPLLKLGRSMGQGTATVLAKLEFFNPAGSIKDRCALGMVLDAEERGLLRPGSTIVEPTSGNTGIGLGMVAAVRGYKLILVMPETASLERRSLLKAFGSELILSPAKEGMAGSVRIAREMVAEHPEYFMPGQFDNPANPEIHRRTTAREILEATGGRLDAFVAGVGTGGTITGVGQVLKKEVPGVLVVAVEPLASPMLSRGQSGAHKIQGMGANFLPTVLDRGVYDRIVSVDDDDAFSFSRLLAREEGILVGISAGAAALAARAVARELGPGRTVVTVLPDTGERYLSMEDKFRLKEL